VTALSPLEVIYLLAYSPNFYHKNLYAKLKNILHFIKTSNYQELGKAREFAFNEITLENI